MPSSLANKKELSEAAQGPPWVRSAAAVQTLGIGHSVRAIYDWWFDLQRRRRCRQLDASAVAAFRASHSQLTSTQQRIVHDLESRGIAHAHITDLPGGNWWNTLRAEVEPWLASPDVLAAEHAYRTSEERRWKDYLVRMFGRGAAIPFTSVWTQFAIQPALLDVVNSYLGMLSKILYIDVWNTVPLVHAGPDMGSQRWHRDPEDAKLVKIFLYFSDVGDSAGPMQYVPNSRRGERFGSLWPQQFPKGSVPPPDEFERAIPRSEWATCTHPAGTLLFVDTSGFHRGGRALDSRRVLATWTYTRQSSVWPRAFELTGAPESLPPPVRFALAS